MTRKVLPDYVFAESWEVCNKVGGIHTVLSTQAKTLQERLPDRIVYLGPDLGDTHSGDAFIEDERLKPHWKSAALAAGIPIRIGRWNVPGQPIAILVDWRPLIPQRNAIYRRMWDDFKVDSLHAYGDYDEACLCSYATGMAVAALIRAERKTKQGLHAVFHAHEWMCGFGLLYIKKNCPGVKTVFTTHATTVGRSITTNEKPLYDYFDGYFGDQMAQELHVEAKHSVEKQTALAADVLTTVSEMTDRECRQFFGRESDILLPNGFEPSFVPTGQTYVSKRGAARQKTLEAANALLGTNLADDTVIISTSGRNDYRCKGFDVFVHAMRLLQDMSVDRPVVAFIVVPCWKKEARKDLQQAMLQPQHEPLASPFITHWLYNMEEDRILNTIKGYGVRTGKDERVHVVLVPTYLDGQDGIFNLSYYDWLIGNDLCIYPSYYEPWGYTPLESAAFGIPCITTDLSGFGQWVNAELHHEGKLADGIEVMHRTDSNSKEVSEQMASVVQRYVNASRKQQKTAGKAAQAIARKAQWKNFIKNYYQAYEINEA